MATNTLAPLETLYETTRGKALPLPPRLAHLYGRLRMPSTRGRTHVINNFASTLDGVVSLNVKGLASGGDISGYSAQDTNRAFLLRECRCTNGNQHPRFPARRRIIFVLTGSGFMLMAGRVVQFAQCTDKRSYVSCRTRPCDGSARPENREGREPYCDANGCA